MAKRDTSLGRGVYFAIEDYIGLFPRIIVFIVDSIILLIALLVLLALSPVVRPFLSIEKQYSGAAEAWCFIAFLLFAWIYLTVLKTSRFRTVGYWLAGARIVTLQGNRPSPIRMTLRMTLRLTLLATGPKNFLFDLLWSGIDDDKQTLRDRFLGTCVVKTNAEPIGEGEVHLARYFATGFNLAYPKVFRPKK